ncbi:MAG: segregation and condensation protein B [Pseudomonadales bacterium]|jgi:segregation and condensation protein B
MTFDPDRLKRILEGALLAAGKPMTVIQLESLFEEDGVRPARDEIKAALDDITNDIKGRGFELMQVASGYRFQVCDDLAPWIGRLWEEKPQKYSRALLETLALIAYRQPITRGDIEEIRGVAVSSNIIRTLMDRDWVRVVGHREVPGRPAMYASTKIFLDYFNLKSLDQLPPLAEIQDLDNLTAELGLEVIEDVAEPVSEDTGKFISQLVQSANDDAGLDEIIEEAEVVAENDSSSLFAEDYSDSTVEENSENDSDTIAIDNSVAELPIDNSSDKK